MRLFHFRRSGDEALDLERAWRLVHIAREDGRLAKACPVCDYPDVLLVDDRGTLAGLIRHPALLDALLVLCPSCGVAVGAVRPDRQGPA